MFKPATFTNTVISNIDAAIRGMRNPLNSWHKADSELYTYALSPMDNSELHNHHVLDMFGSVALCFRLGPNDLDLACRLIKGGSEHRKFLRQIQVSVDINAPRYFWQEFDTYKVGTAANSCSTMHTIHERLLTEDDFTHINPEMLAIVNWYVKAYQENRSVDNLRALKANLPEGFVQMRTCTLNYENILNMSKHRYSHRLPEWNTDFKEWTLSLPYISVFLEAMKQSTSPKASQI